jgi:hypothetical protein
LILEDFPKSATKIQVPSISYKNNVSFFIWKIMRGYGNILVLPRMRNVLKKRCRGNQNTNLFSTILFRKICRLWDNAGNVTFPRQQWLGEGTIMLGYMYTVCFVQNNYRSSV